VILTVTDDRGGQNSVSQDVTTGAAPNRAPTAAFGSQTAVRSVTVDGSGSSDPDGTIASYSWNWGDGSPDGSGVSASHLFTTDGSYTVTLTVTDNEGATGTVAKSLTVTAVVAADAFARTLASSWGSADSGGAWTLTGGASKFSVTGQTGQILMSTAGSGPSAALTSLSVRDVDGVLDFAVDKPATGGGVYTTVTTRKVGTSNYNFTLKFLAGGAVTVAIAKSDNGTATSLGSATVAGLTYAVGDVVRLRFQALGAGPTALAVKAWKVGAAEPAAFQLSRTDSTASVQGAGSLTVQAYLSSGSTNAPVTGSFDNLAVLGG
jgi:PKD repeat protein